LAKCLDFLWDFELTTPVQSQLRILSGYPKEEDEHARISSVAAGTQRGVLPGRFSDIQHAG
jgi:hypothetical protein